MQQYFPEKVRKTIETIKAKCDGNENSRKMEFVIYDKDSYSRRELFYRPHYTLPVIRYGVYKRNGKKIAELGLYKIKVVVIRKVIW